MGKRGVLGKIFQVVTIIALVLLGHFYLQFGLQALFQFVPQGVLSLVGAVFLGWGAVLTFQRRPASGKVFWGTVPILLFHVVATLVDTGELPFLIGSLPVPIVAGLIWFIRRRPDSAEGHGRDAVEN